MCLLEKKVQITTQGITAMFGELLPGGVNIEVGHVVAARRYYEMLLAQAA